MPSTSTSLEISLAVRFLELTLRQAASSSIQSAAAESDARQAEGMTQTLPLRMEGLL